MKQESSTKHYWKSLDELSNTPEYQEYVKRVDPEIIHDQNPTVSRREFLQFMGASLALAGATSCRRPVQNIVPYVKQPEEIIPGIPLYYATTMPLGEEAIGLLVESHEGRPTKIEGNELHPASLGKANTYAQAAILNLYDPDRMKIPLNGWQKFSVRWSNLYPELIKSGGAEMAVISEAFVSPTLSRLKNEFSQKFPHAQWATYEPVNNETIYDGIMQATGNAYRPVHHFDKADIVVSLDADFLLTDSNSIVNAYQFSQKRRVQKRHDRMNRLYAVESYLSVTGAMADHRLRLRSTQIADFTKALAIELNLLGMNAVFTNPETIYLRDEQKQWLKVIAAELWENRGRSILIAGRRQPDLVHAIVYAVNAALGNHGKTITYYEPKDASLSHLTSLTKVIDQIETGKIKTVIVIGGNPVYNAPADLQLDKVFEKVKNIVHLGADYNETSEKSQYFILQSHFLESWGDARAMDGTLSIIQPLIAPLHDSKSNAEFIHFLTTGNLKSDFELLHDTWIGLLPSAAFASEWRKIIHDGVYSGSNLPPLSPEVDAQKLSQFITTYKSSLPASQNPMEIVFVASAALFDGRFANNGWLQELPDPMTKIVWDNAACISPKTATELGLDLSFYEKLGRKKHAMLSITYEERNIKIPVYILPGHADDSITMALGYGRKISGMIARDRGFNSYSIRTAKNPNFTVGVTVALNRKNYELATTQDHANMEGRPLIREATLEGYNNNEDLTPRLTQGPPLISLWKDQDYSQGHQWGMVIDLNVCTGCNACVTACQSENNIPVVGKKEAGYGREMHWIRIDRYYSGSSDDPQVALQPVPCMQCENAPCEQVCPVQATNHDREGLNVMVYNRCVGTRYCSNNCPYKVRHFNYFNYTKHGPETRIRGETHTEIQFMSQNPDVTVRSRGVMEKCTYCTQRINEAKIRAKLGNKTLQDGDIVPACEQTCPVNAIVFGDIRDQNSRVSRLKMDDKNYVLLGELNTRPRTSYLGKLRNPNPALLS